GVGAGARAVPGVRGPGQELPRGGRWTGRGSTGWAMRDVARPRNLAAGAPLLSVGQADPAVERASRVRVAARPGPARRPPRSRGGLGAGVGGIATGRTPGTVSVVSASALSTVRTHTMPTFGLHDMRNAPDYATLV